jgi:diacylglycerol O-acyltransferase / wax synthase
MPEGVMPASTSELLSFGDALFLYLEREGIPLNVASVTVFEGPIAKDDLVRYLDSKHLHIPRFRQRVVSPPFNVGLPSWENDPYFDVSNHVHEVTLKHGTDKELRSVASRILSTTLDRRRPLWDQTLVHGLKGHRSAIILRIHHAMADGVSGVGILHELLDTSPAMPKLPRRKPRAPEPPPQRDPVSMMVEGIVSTCLYATQRAIEAQGQIMAMAEQIAGMLANASAAPPDGTVHARSALPPLDQIGQLLPELASATNRLPFNQTICQGPQHFRWAELSLADIKAVKNACGATVNDVILSIVTATIRRYAELHHAPTAGKLLRIVVPVNVRGNGSVSDLGNEITFVPASIPLDIRDGRELVDAVHQRMAMLKVARVGELVGIAASIFGAIPTPVQAFLGPIASQLPISACNTICTNVPGPQHPLYLLGRKMVKIYPYVPIGGEMGMNCAILTYDGTAFFGFTADTAAMPDAELLEKFVAQSFAEIRASVGVRGQRKPPVRKSALRKRKVKAPAGKEFFAEAEKEVASGASAGTAPRARTTAPTEPAPITGNTKGTVDEAAPEQTLAARA